MLYQKNNMIINKTKKVTLSKDHKVCKTILSKTKGLMFSTKQKTLLFIWEQEKIRNIHMFFVFFPIDVLYLNKEKKVMALKKRLMPFSISNITTPAQYIIELQQRTIKRTNTQINDIIDF